MKKIYMQAFWIFLSAFIYVLAYERETDRIMPFVASSSYCTGCHDKSDEKELLENPSRSCDRFCVTCHGDKKSNHHKVGIRIGRAADNLRYTAGARIACFTCHDLDNIRFDTSSWKSESLFDIVFRRKSRHNTYYLTVKNNYGQLCKKCH